MLTKLTSNFMTRPMPGDEQNEDLTQEPLLQDEEIFDDAVSDTKDDSSQNNIRVVDGNLIYDNIKEDTKAERDLLDFSLHTVESQDSIDLSKKLNTPDLNTEGPTENPEEAENLSFHASQVDMSELTEVNEAEKIEDPATTQDENHLETEESTKTESSSAEDKLPPSTQDKQAGQKETEGNSHLPRNGMFYKVKVSVVLLIVLFLSLKFATKNLRPAGHSESYDAPQATVAEPMESSILNVTNDIAKPIQVSSFTGKAVGIKLNTEGVSVFIEENEIKEELISQESLERIGNRAFNTSVLATLVLITLSRFMKKSPSSEDSDAEEEEDDSQTIKKEQVATQNYDLSKYDELKVVDLRDLLRKRSCKTVGKKPKLIRRLAAVYKAELETLTVVQLRRLLKAKNFKQTGRKHEIIRKLVEDGF